jgi:hypothetical protein
MASRKLSKSQRTERARSEDRADRALGNRQVTDSRELTDSERLDAFRRSFYQSSLPDLPKIPGWHVCWLTTANPRDPIHGRLRLGYELIKAVDIPGWEHASVKSAEYEGCIGVNEMVAAKLPSNLYEAYMQEAHHVQPLNEEEKLTIANEVIAEEAAMKVRRPKKALRPLVMEEGMEELGQAPPAPNFSESLGE